jgi:5-bromo-4-chloroindolyl phosphate hydrolysis protein
MDIPMPDQIYEIKLIFWLFGIFLLILSSLITWFLVRHIQNQDDLNKKFQEDIKIARNDCSAFDRMTRDDVKLVKNELLETEQTIKRIKAESERALILLTHIARQIDSIKETLNRHEHVIYDIKENLSKH